MTTESSVCADRKREMRQHAYNGSPTSQVRQPHQKNKKKVACPLYKVACALSANSGSEANHVAK